MGIATPTTFESAGGKFSNFRGTIVEVSYSAFANYVDKDGKNDPKTGFFLRALIIPAPGEDLTEPLEKFWSGGQLKFTVPSTGPNEADVVNLESTDDSKLQGPYAWSLMQKPGLVKDTNIEALINHMNENTSFDKSRWEKPRIDDALLGLDAFWIDVEQPERSYADKSSRFRKPAEDESGDKRKPTFLAPDKIFGYVEKSKLPKAGVTSAMQPSAVSDKLQETMTTFIAALAADGPVEISSITNALIRQQKEFGDDLPNLLTLATVEWLSASDEWTFADGKVTAK